jgi:hypothetical protein
MDQVPETTEQKQEAPKDQVKERIKYRPVPAEERFMLRELGANDQATPPLRERRKSFGVPEPSLDKQETGDAPD